MMMARWMAGHSGTVGDCSGSCSGQWPTGQLCALFVTSVLVLPCPIPADLHLSLALLCELLTGRKPGGHCFHLDATGHLWKLPWS